MERRFYQIVIAVCTLMLGILFAALDSPNAYGIAAFWKDFGGLFISLAAFLFAYFLALSAARMAVDMQRRTKLADFRQTWINDFRTDVAKLISIKGQGNNFIGPGGELNEVRARLQLRLKPGGQFEDEIYLAICELAASGDEDTFQDSAKNVAILTQAYLKTEWDELKKELGGER